MVWGTVLGGENVLLVMDAMYLDKGRPVHCTYCCTDCKGLQYLFKVFVVGVGRGGGDDWVALLGRGLCYDTW